MNQYQVKVENRKERLLALADRMQSASDAAYQQARKMADVIPFGQPILVGHHSEGRDRRYRARIWRTQDRCLELQRKAAHFRQMAAGVGTGGISSDDPEAVQQLLEKLAKLERGQAVMVAANKIIRKHKQQPSAVPELVALGISEGKARDLLKPDFCGRIGFAGYETSNNNANIRRIKERITALQQLDAKREQEDREHDCGSYRVVECFTDNRVRVFFPGKPSEQIRSTLKSHGFRWSPDAGAWQRMLSDGLTQWLTQEDGYLRKALSLS